MSAPYHVPAHHAPRPPPPVRSIELGRVATVLIFLNDVQGGGHTIFPQGRWLDTDEARTFAREVLGQELPASDSAEWDTSHLPPLGSYHEASQPSMGPFCDSPAVLRIKPVAGSGILWYNHDQQLDMDWGTLHGGCPPHAGARKFITQRWIRWYTDEDGPDEGVNSFFGTLEECGVLGDAMGMGEAIEREDAQQVE